VSRRRGHRCKVSPSHVAPTRRHTGRRAHPAGLARAPVCGHSVTVRQPSPLLRQGERILISLISWQSCLQELEEVVVVPAG
jgi:hypothetical protein